MLQAEEMLQAKLLANQHKNELQNIIEMLELWKKDWTKITDATRVLTQIIKKYGGVGQPGKIGYEVCIQADGACRVQPKSVQHI